MQDDPYLKGLDVYLVGGAVRDMLLSETACMADKDWVVVGSTPEDMVARGFKPVGEGFPVFLHPKTQEEYALARTERKVGVGYKGFTFYAGKDVTLEQDLKRRDLTINAMAWNGSALVDPYGGLADLKAKVLRHVGPAFVEDPVRVLRLARFHAQFPDFTIAPETLDLCREMVRCGELDHLVPERIWQELVKALGKTEPARFFECLETVGAMPVVLPGVVISEIILKGLPECALEAAYGLMCSEMAPSSIPALNRLLRATRAAGDIAVLWHKVKGVLTPLVAQSAQPHPVAGVVLAHPAAAHPVAGVALAEQVLEVLNMTDAWRRPQRFADVLSIAAVRARLSPDQQSTLRRQWAHYRDVGLQIDANALKQNTPAAQMPSAIQQARLTALKAVC